jgi:hypothetical protein
VSQYPDGAGPNAGRFWGEVYQPPGLPIPGSSSNGGGGSSDRPVILSAHATVDGQGRTIATFEAPPTQAWLVRRIVVQSTIRGQALVYIGTLDPTNVVSGTLVGDFDENETAQPYLVAEGDTLSVVWIAGGDAWARIEFNILGE